MKTSDLIGPALNYCVAKCEGISVATYGGVVRLNEHDGKSVFGPEMKFSTNWAQGGPIVEREHICSFFYSSDEDGQPCTPAWEAYIQMDGIHYTGKTQLIATMRCYVASKLGDEVDVPKELL